MLNACHILDTGHCLASEHHLIAGGARRRIECHALVALLRHPEHGWVLWDTGYAPRLIEATRRLPFLLYRAVTPLRLRPELAVAAQLAPRGLTPRDIGLVLLSHFHADHLSGLRDFPDAKVVATRAAYEDVAGRTGLAALRRAFVPALMPDDFAGRATLLNPFEGPPLPHLGPTHDVFGDGTLRLVALPGHARGQMGLLAETDKGPFLFVADACYLTRSVAERRPPHRATNLFADDARAVRTTLDGLNAFHRACPGVTIVPTHCPDAYARLVEPS